MHFYSPDCLHLCIITVFSIPSAAKQSQTNSCSHFKAGKIVTVASARLQWMMEWHPPLLPARVTQSSADSPGHCLCTQSALRFHSVALLLTLCPISLHTPPQSHRKHLADAGFDLLCFWHCIVTIRKQCMSFSSSKTMKHPVPRNKLDGRVTIQGGKN